MDGPHKISSAVTSSRMGLLILMSYRTALMSLVATIFLAKFATLFAMARANSFCPTEEYSSGYSNSIRCYKETCMRLIPIKIIKLPKFNTIMTMLFRTRLLLTNKSQLLRNL